MEFKLKHVYIYIFCLILVIGIFAGISTMSVKKVPTNNINTSQKLDEMIEDNKPENQNPSQENNNSQQPTNPVKIYREGFSCVSDALEILDNCKGYKINLSLTGNAEVMGINAVQSIQETMIYSGNYYLKETKATCTSSLGPNYYRYFYSDDNGKNVEYKKVELNSDNSPNFSKVIDSANVDKQTLLREIDYLAYSPFSIRASKENSRIVKFDAVTDKKYYIISFVTEPSKVPQLYVQNAIKEGGLESMKVNSIKLTYYIEKETLYLRHLKREENYTMTKGVSITVDTVQDYVITVIDKELTAQKPC